MEQTSFLLRPGGDKQFVNLLEWRSHKPNEVKFRSLAENHRKNTVILNSDEKLEVIFMVFGDLIKPEIRKFTLALDGDTLTAE
jgi:hypothetical protein